MIFWKIKIRLFRTFFQTRISIKTMISQFIFVFSSRKTIFYHLYSFYSLVVRNFCWRRLKIFRFPGSAEWNLGKSLSRSSFRSEMEVAKRRPKLTLSKMRQVFIVFEKYDFLFQYRRRRNLSQYDATWSQKIGYGKFFF